MLYYFFKDYEEFKELFGLRECGNGVKARKNKILLDCLKDRELFHAYVRNDESTESIFAKMILSCRTNEEALKKLLLALKERDFLRTDNSSTFNCFVLLDKYFLYSEKCNIGKNRGICIDSVDNNRVGYVRYVNTESGRVFKKKAGRFIHSILDEYRHIPLALSRYLEETFAREWIAYTSDILDDSKYTLVVDDDFESIYTGSRCVGNFNSCMVNDEFYTFYENAVKAKAASLRNECDKIVARCIIFTHAYDEDANQWRLAERQYAAGQSDLLKLQLVNALIRGGYIDAYKRIGAGCSGGDNERDFIDITGKSLSDKEFYIDMNLEVGDTVSYQDSFKWYDYRRDIAYNNDQNHYTDELDVTEGYFREPNHDDEEWSEYNYEYIPSDSAYYVPSRGDYFYENQVVQINGELYFKDDCCRCDYCGDWYYVGHYLDKTKGTYCCEDCRDRALEDWACENDMERCDYDDEWYDSCDMVNVYVSDPKSKKRHTERFFIDNAEWCLTYTDGYCYYNGKYYQGNLVDGIPAEFNLKHELEMWAA